MTLTLNQILTLLLGAGGAGGIAGLFNMIRAARRGKLEDEETLIKRLNDDNKNQKERADQAEAEASKMRRQRNVAWDQAARYRRRLIAMGVDEESLGKMVDFHE